MESSIITVHNLYVNSDMDGTKESLKFELRTSHRTIYLQDVQGTLEVFSRERYCKETV